MGGRRLVVLSLEHPPTWISLVYVALMQSSFNESFVTAVVDEYGESCGNGEFQKALIDLAEFQKGGMCDLSSLVVCN